MSGPISQEDPAENLWANPKATYDLVADRYADHFSDELDGKPFDRDLLTRFVSSQLGDRDRTGPICDLGCGPGHVGAFLAQHGANVFGLDLSLGMLTQCRRNSPTMPLSQGDMTSLGVLDGAVSGIVCFYALIHIPRSRVGEVLDELRRVLVAGGSLLLAVHGGTGTLHATEMLDRPANLHATLFTRAELVGLLDRAGFDVVEAHDREPYEHEVATQRLYVWASRRA